MDDEKKPIPDFAILRKLAEAASGARGNGEHQVVWLVYDPEPPDPFEPFKHKVRVAPSKPREGEFSGKAVVLPVSSKTTNDEPVLPDLAQIGLKEKRIIDLLNLTNAPKGKPRIFADSVFWTESAVEKFVVPYYASVHGPEAGRKVEAVLKMLHGKADEPKNGADNGGNGPAEGNFALIHLPTSEYVDDTGAAEGVEGRADEFYVARVERGAAVLVSLDAWVDRAPRPREE